MNRQPRARVAALNERSGETQRIEQLQGPRLHRERAGFVTAVERPVDDAEVGAEPAELRGERETSWTRANDQNVDVDLQSTAWCRTCFVGPCVREARYAVD